MLGLGDKEGHIDPTKLSVFVHDIKDGETYGMTQKVWDNNARYVVVDQTNHKELMRFMFSNPTCVVWLQRDQGRSDTYEMVLIWEGKSREDTVTEVYVISAPADSAPIGDTARAKSLLSAMLASPSIVPVRS